MKSEEFKQLIHRSIDEIDVSVDQSKEIMTTIENSRLKRSHYRARKYLVMVAMFFLCSSVIFAGVKTLKIIELKNQEDQVVGTVEVIDSDENPHLDSHVSMEELIRYGDQLSGSAKWDGKSFLVIDREAEYPYNMDLRLKSEHYRSYHDIVGIEERFMLPENIGDYHFDSLSASFSSEFPEKEDVERLLSENTEDRFVVSEMESGDMMSFSYYYQSPDNELSMWLRFELESRSSIFRALSGLMEDYEVVRIGDIDGFLVKEEYTGVTYEAEGPVKLLGENCYSISWYEPSLSMKIHVDPSTLSWSRETSEDEDGNKIYVEQFPEETREKVIEFATMVHKLLNEEE